ncbi:MAG: prepilin-type N-terminal cleavage/methylation domain-containing protein [Candidatus Obscuribacterales bacterium]|nr:prepilin-type N-terminal cleavage/methylation domain-containing protein [Candidatus Obscuribacterales bacterium]
MAVQRQSKGFTLVELLVVVVIVGILAAIALPNFIGAQKKSKNAAVKSNMRTVQIAAETYGTDSGGRYGLDPGVIQNYAPGGSNSFAGGQLGTWPANPVDVGIPGVVAGTALADAAAVAALRNSILTGTNYGQTSYSGTTDQTSYAVWAMGADGRTVTDAIGTKALILSNQ